MCSEAACSPWNTFSSVQFSSVSVHDWAVVSNSLWPHGLQHIRPPCPSPTPGAYSDSCHWVSNAIHLSHSVITFSSCLKSFPASESFQMSQFFASGGQSIRVSASTSVLPMNIQDYYYIQDIMNIQDYYYKGMNIPLGWTGWISLLPKGLSKVFSNTTVQKDKFFGTQLSLESNSHIHTWLLEKP